MRWAHGMPRRVLGTSTSLSRYIFTCIPSSRDNELPVIFNAYAPRGPATSGVGECREPQSVWPMPPPFVWHSGCPPKSSRLRSRWRQNRACELLVNMYVCLLSYLHLGRPRQAPREGRFRDRLLSPEQQRVLYGLWEDCSVLVRPPHQMGGRGAANLESTFEYGVQVSNSSVGENVPAPPGLQSTAFSADRAKFLSTNVPGFDPVPWLPVLEGATYLEPRLLEVADAPCDLPVAKFSAHRREAVKFAELIDSSGRLYLAPAQKRRQRPIA